MFFVCGLNASAQFIQEKTLSEIVLTGPEQQFAQNIASNPETKTLKYISIGDIAQYAANDTVAFNLPGLGTVSGHAVRVDYKAPDDYVWSGNLTSQPGFFSFIAVPGGKVGFVQTSTRYFGILPLNNTVSLLKEVEVENLPSVECPVFDPPEVPENSVDFCAQDVNDCFAEIHVLVLLSTDLINWFGNSANGWQALAMTVQGIEGVNLAFANSGIPNKRIRWRAQLFDFSAFFDTPLDIEDDILTDLPAQAGALRESLQADVVIMLTNQDYPGIAGASSPIGPTEGNAYGIVEIASIADPRWTFAHEFAHTLGARHNRPSNCSPAGVCGDDNANVCAHAWGFRDRDNNFQRTILARMNNDEGAFRIPHYSNPDIVFNGGATGTQENDNSRIIRNSACFVSTYNQAEWSVQFVSPNTWCIESTPSLGLTATVKPTVPGWGLPGVEPYQYTWEISCSADFSTFQTRSGLSITLQSPPCGNSSPFWIRFRVTGSDGAQILAPAKKINVLDCGNGSKVRQIFSGILFFPNPASNTLDVTVESPALEPTLLMIRDSHGRIVHQLQTLFESKVSVDLTTVPSGVYFVSLQNGTHIETRKLIIQK